MQNNRNVGMVLLSVWVLATVGCGLTSDLDDLKPSTDDDTSSTEITDCETADDCDAAAPYCVNGDCVACETTDHCEAGNWCDAGDCVTCNDDRHCGASCTACEHPTGVCNDAGEACAECNSNSPCASGNWCNEGTCEECNTAEHCGSECDPCTGETPACAEDGSMCVECVEHADCAGPIGICTPDNICTCLAHDADPKANCSADADCGDTDYSCAMDFSDTDPAVDTDKDHFACLRKCPVSNAMTNGLECKPQDLAESGFERVWVPVTSCFAFAQHVSQKACSFSTGLEMCSASHDTYIYEDANCTANTCTYPCSTADDCLAGEECNSSSVCAIP